MGGGSCQSEVQCDAECAQQRGQGQAAPPCRGTHTVGKLKRSPSTQRDLPRGLGSLVSGRGHSQPVTMRETHNKTELQQGVPCISRRRGGPLRALAARARSAPRRGAHPPTWRVRAAVRAVQLRGARLPAWHRNFHCPACWTPTYARQARRAAASAAARRVRHTCTPASHSTTHPPSHPRVAPAVPARRRGSEGAARRGELDRSEQLRGSGSACDRFQGCRSAFGRVNSVSRPIGDALGPRPTP